MCVCVPQGCHDLTVCVLCCQEEVEAMRRQVQDSQRLLNDTALRSERELDDVKAAVRAVSMHVLHEV